MKKLVWNYDEVRDYLQPRMVEFARCKEPRGWKSILKNKYGNLRGKCFRNSLFAALCSNRGLYYCEGYAMIEGNWYEHAWVSPVETSSAEVNWAYDLTWPWKPKSGDNTEVSCYVGAQFDADFVSDFLEYVKSIEGYASSSVLKYAHYLKSFDNSLI